MPALSPLQAVVAPNVLLDGRLALHHEKERWLAIADVHFGYELSQRAAGMVEEIVDVESVGELQIKGLSRPVSASNVLILR